MEKKEKITSHLKHLVEKIYFPYFGEVAMQDCLKKTYLFLTQPRPEKNYICSRFEYI